MTSSRFLRRQFACRLFESRAELHDVRDSSPMPTLRRHHAICDQRLCGSNARFLIEDVVVSPNVRQLAPYCLLALTPRWPPKAA